MVAQLAALSLWRSGHSALFFCLPAVALREGGFPVAFLW